MEAASSKERFARGCSSVFCTVRELRKPIETRNGSLRAFCKPKSLQHETGLTQRTGSALYIELFLLESLRVYLHVGVSVCICLNFCEFVLEHTSARFARSGRALPCPALPVVK
eukprot:11509298-Karenia_brevis.AAC.1